MWKRIRKRLQAPPFDEARRGASVAFEGRRVARPRSDEPDEVWGAIYRSLDRSRSMQDWMDVERDIFYAGTFYYYTLNDGLDWCYAHIDQGEHEPTEAALVRLGAADAADALREVRFWNEANEDAPDHEVSKYMARSRELEPQCGADDGSLSRKILAYADANYPWRSDD